MSVTKIDSNNLIKKIAILSFTISPLKYMYINIKDEIKKTVITV